MIKNDEAYVDIVNNLSNEIRRGALVLAVLSCMNERQYGYSLKESLAEDGLVIDQGTLYPLMRRLEKQGLLDSEWDVGGNRPRRYYILSKAGADVLEEITREWKDINAIIANLLRKSEGDRNGTG